MRDETAGVATIVRRLLVSALAVAAIWSTGAPASALVCDQADAYEQAVGTVGGGGSHLSVPLVIHIMERPGRPCEVRQQWTAQQVSTVFGAGTQDERSVNAVWEPTGVRFSVREVLLHSFTPLAGLVDSNQRIKVPTAGPRGDDAFEAAFDDLVAGFHRDHSVNVYLWRTITGPPVGFGRSTRTGKGKATVFLDVVCAQRSLRACATLAAHELGHALGLYHAGPDTCTNVDAAFQVLCSRLAAPCAGVRTTSRLMTMGASGRKLCPQEVEAAEQMARDEFQ
jgi:hypothetical protein